MTTEIEKKFFIVFGIKPKNAFEIKVEYLTRNLGGQPEAQTTYKIVYKVANTKSAEIKVIDDIRKRDKFSRKFTILESNEIKIYPTITDRILLELICLLNRVECDSYIICPDIESLRETVLENCYEYIAQYYEDGDCLNWTDCKLFYNNVRKLFGMEE